MAKGENWGAFRFLYVCCDYGVCLNQMTDDLGETCAPAKCADWINEHLIDSQDEHDETCEGCVWNQ